MVSFGELLQQSEDAIVARWLKAALSVYPDEASGAFRRQKDPFANPIGHSLRTGTREIFEALLDSMDSMDSERIHRNLQEIISIRAVQEISASQTVAFIFELRNAVRAELGASASEPQVASELARFDDRIDQVALAAFDVYVENRERLCDLRVNEVKRQVSWIVNKMNAGGATVPESVEVQPEAVP